MLRTYHPLQPSSEGNYLVGTLQVTFDKNTRKRVSVYENSLLVIADNPKAALEEAVRLATAGNYEYTGEDGVIYQVEFIGISHLAPIHGDLVSGTELSWLDLSGIEESDLKDRIFGETADEAYRVFDSIKEDSSNFPRHVLPPDDT